MKIALIIFCVCFCISCSVGDGKTDKKDTSQENQLESDAIEKDQDTITVKFADDIVLQWDVVNNRLIKDAAYTSIFKDQKKIDVLVNSISDDVDLGVKIPGKETNFKKGDLAYIFLDLPTFSCLQIQFDVVRLTEDGNGYVHGLFDYIDNNRTEVVDKVKKYMKTNDYLNFIKEYDTRFQ